MKKIAIIGMERVGKTTTIRDIAATLSRDHKVETIIFDEIINHPQNINLDLRDKHIQKAMIFDQMRGECLIEASEMKDFLLVDRTPLETLTYYSELETDTDILSSMTLTVINWMYSYDQIFTQQHPFVDIKPNNHFTKEDLKKRPKRSKLLSNYFRFYLDGNMSIINRPEYLKQAVIDYILKSLES